MRAPEFWQRRGFASALLAPLGALYGASVAWKAQHARPYRAKARVLCVGNLTAGGSGKTPVAIAIGAHLKAKGRRVFFLTRGYGGSLAGPLQVQAGHKAADVGDEALLLAQTAPTVVARDRAAGATLAEKSGAEIIVMDDGHQNFSLAKDLSLVVVDGETGFGNGRMIPAGPLREPVRQGLARADLVVIMNGGDPDLMDYDGSRLRARLATIDADLKGRRVFAFAGIGRPEKFVASLKHAGAIVTGTQFFADHHPFTSEEIASLKARAGDALPITTAKDFVRLSKSERGDIAVLSVQARFDDNAALDRLLARLA
ncbi:MAG TPA: tetraacyldisaccharide 4'-kinase [Rhizomicrobium sp.]|jgi:tetraacyldisaccharide 4'-kinase|nr:tetraacyldisaccharide 4'-kinase [Rhizomicrobium sp.]